MDTHPTILTAIVIAAIGALPAIISLIFIRSLKLEINSRMTRLLNLTRREAKSQGMRDEKARSRSHRRRSP